MRVLHVNHLLDPVSGGGTAERTFQLSRELALMGADCTILTLDIGESRSRAVDIDRLRVEALRCIHPRFFLPKVSPARIRAIVAEVDIVQMFGNWTLLNFLVWQACLHLGKPFVFCPAGALPSFGRSLLLKSLYTRFVSLGMVRDAAGCICITQDERDHFLHLGADEGKLVTIPNGIDPQQYELVDTERQIAGFRESLGIGSAPFLLYLGRLNPIKGPDILLEAFGAIAEKWPEHHLVMGGPDGGMLAQLTASAASRGLSGRVHFPGFVNSTAKAAALNAAQLLIIPSRSEAMSIVVLEGGACGCPALFTDACGLASIEERGTGTMVPVDARAMAPAIDRLLQQPTELKAQGERLRQVVMDEYLWRGQAGRYLALYETILQHRPPSASVARA